MAPQTKFWHFNVTLANVQAWCTEYGHLEDNWNDPQPMPEQDDRFMRFLVKGNNAQPHFAAFSLRRERGLEQGTIHYQGWLKCLKRSTKGQVLNADNPLSTILKLKGHISPAAKANQESDNYLDKVETSIPGFTKLRSKEIKVEAKPPKKNVAYYFIEDLREKGLLYTWQAQVVDRIEDMLAMPRDFTHFFKEPFFSREINILIEAEGNKGKSVFIDYLEQKYWPQILVVPSIMGEGSQLVNFMCSTFTTTNRKVDDVKIVFFDLPRGISDAMGKQKVLGFFANLEQVKNGKLFDWRHQAREVRWTFWPGVMLTCNTLPDGFEKAMSKDRWRKGYIVPKYDTPDMEEDYHIVDEPPAPAVQDVDNDALAGGDAPPAFEAAVVDE